MKVKSIVVDGIKIFVINILAAIVSMLVATLLGIGALFGAVVGGTVNTGTGIFAAVIVLVVYILALGVGKQLLFKK